jgi:hypothetical protein
LDIFMRGFSLSSCPQHSLKVLLLLNPMCLSKVRFSTVNRISHISVRINCNQISEGLLYRPITDALPVAYRL